MAAGKNKRKTSTRRKPAKRSFADRLRMAGRAGSVLLALAACAYLVSGLASRHWDEAAQGFYESAKREGMRVNRIIIEGRELTPRDDVHAIAETAKGQPILAVELELLHARLSGLPTVRDAHVMRILPEILYIVLEERQPIAIYQTAQGQALMDAEGVVVPVTITDKYRRSLPVVAGRGADAAFQSLLQALAAQPHLARQVKGAVYVGERRWNVRLANGIEVKLPEADMVAAWNYLAELDETDHILARDLQVIDMRIDGQLYVRQREPQPIGEQG